MSCRPFGALSTAFCRRTVVLVEIGQRDTVFRDHDPANRRNTFSEASNAEHTIQQRWRNANSVTVSGVLIEPAKQAHQLAHGQIRVVPTHLRRDSQRLRLLWQAVIEFDPFASHSYSFASSALSRGNGTTQSVPCS